MDSETLRKAADGMLIEGVHPMLRLLADAVRLLLDGPLEDILALRGEKAEKIAWCVTMGVPYSVCETPDTDGVGHGWHNRSHKIGVRLLVTKGDSG